MDPVMARQNQATANRRPAVWWWPVTVVVLALAAFFPTYFGRFPGFPGTSSSVHVHVAIMFAWMALTIVQPILIHRRRFELHRQLGRLSYILLPLLAAGFWLVMRDGQLRHKQPDLILATAFDGFMFFFLVGMGLYYRRRRAYHGRFMMLSLVPFLNPTLGRLVSPAVSVPLELVLLIALLVRARRRREDSRPYAIALTAFLCALAVLVLVMVALPNVPELLWHVLFGDWGR
jgi:hypothetical protein